MSSLRRTLRRRKVKAPPPVAPVIPTAERILFDVHVHGAAVVKVTRGEAMTLFPPITPPAKCPHGEPWGKCCARYVPQRDRTRPWWNR